MPRHNQRRAAPTGSDSDTTPVASPSSMPEAKIKKSKPKRELDDFVVSAPHFFQSSVSNAQARMGQSGSLVGTDAERVVIGLPLLAFSLQYLYSSSIYPLGRMHMIIGESDSCKTALLFEIGRWFLRDFGGGFIYLLNEARDPAELRTSIIGRDKLETGAFQREGPCASLEDWQRRNTGWLHQFENTFKVGGGCAFPFLLGLDSLTGTTNERVIENIDKEGCAQLTFGQDANLLNQYAKYLFQRLYKWPGSFVATNHIKYGSDMRGNKVMRIPGGDELRYASTYISHLKKLNDIDRLDVAGGRRIIVKMMKSMGDHREIGVDFVWFFDPEKGGEQTSWWDWHSATVELLAGFSGERKKDVERIITFPGFNKSVRKTSCPELGFKKAAPFGEVGSALMREPKLLASLQDHFGIKRRREFTGNVPYGAQIDEALKVGDVVTHSSADIGEVDKSMEDEVDDTPGEVPA